MLGRSELPTLLSFPWCSRPINPPARLSEHFMLIWTNSGPSQHHTTLSSTKFPSLSSSLRRSRL